jgi:rod shape-determining protein MreC
MASKNTTRRRAIILLTLTSIMLVTLDLQDSPKVAGLRSLFGTLFYPVEGVARVITRPVGNAWYGVTNYNKLLDENSLLRQQVAQQEGATVAAAASVRLSQELLALNGLPTLAGINAVTAQVIGESPTSFSQKIEINQGTDSGIRVGMPVLNAAGLIGRITKVFANRSFVMLITDPDFSISVKVVSTGRKTTESTVRGITSVTTSTAVPLEPISNTPDAETTTTTTTTIPIAGFTAVVTTLPSTPQGLTSITVPLASDLDVRETGVIQGNGPTRQPTVRFIDNSLRFGSIEAGVPIVTAGGSRSLAPPDVLIGVVSRVVERVGSAGPLLEIEIAAELTNLSFVRILLYQPITEKKSP